MLSFVADFKGYSLYLNKIRKNPSGTGFHASPQGEAQDELNKNPSGTGFHASPQGEAQDELNKNLAANPGRSPLNHSYGYASSGNQPALFAIYVPEFRSLVQHSG